MNDPVVAFVWRQPKVKEQTALAMIQTYLDGLADDDAEAAQAAGQLAGLSGPASQQGH